MAEPPRLPAILLPWEKSIIYFVTICVKERHKVIDRPEVFEAIETAVTKLQKWHVLAGVIMPDHVHWVVSPAADRNLSIRDFSHGFKRTLRKCFGAQSWEWQRGCFDRLLRSDENLWRKWIYVQDNPMRHGLVQRANDWPYCLDFVNEPLMRGSCQLPLQFAGIGGQ
ncbi:MAG TPA: transposase [Candidatus Udaeobacter sp.]|jgi:putative transposase